MTSTLSGETTSNTIAIIALVFSVTAIVIQIRQFARSGSKLVLKAHTMIDKKESEKEFSIYVVISFMNPGRMSVYVASYWLEMESGDSTWIQPGLTIPDVIRLKTPFKIDSSESVTWAIPFSSIAPKIDKDIGYITFRACAMTSIGEDYYSNPYLILSETVGMPLQGRFRRLFQNLFRRSFRVMRRYTSRLKAKRIYAKFSKRAHGSASGAQGTEK